MTVELQKNAFKAALARGERQIGLWSSTCSNIVVEAVSYSGFDWILLDTEHAPNELPGILSQLQAIAGGGDTTAIVRPAWNDPVLVKRILDIGAQTLLLPFVQTAEEARRAVEAVRYPKAGVRGVSVAPRANRYGRVANYHQRAGEEICLLIQLETASALDALPEIAAVDGIDGIFIGPSDLAADLGHLGDSSHEEVQAAIAAALEACKAAGKPAGILAPKEDEAIKWLEAGFLFVAVGSDLGLLTKNADALARRFQDLP